MKFIFTLPVLMFGIYLFPNMTEGEDTVATQDDWTDCVEQYDSKWGDEDCSQCHAFADTYKALLRNKCSEAIDLKCCVQEENKTWRCFAWFEVTAGDTVAPYACKGNGKIIWWSRKAGDTGTPFPTNEEVNAMYKD